ncbi:PREDICTED: uncharacterized protein LOC109226173 [Nicotiana attenuata]|uniref:uncharacterized protein LOC109226173 n=1 Tax=Nicotiana attenuata TaxID=49451 RepID=UPI0009054414|nr:PREDICTED: uncharacterized protein LOC109226173 [Nicotiana attenuata]
MRDGRKIVKLVQAEVEEECQKWKSALIGYVIGGNPTFKEMLKYVYGVWNFVVTPQVFLHNDGYFIFRFMSDNDKETLLQNGPFTFNNRPMVLKHWEPDFQMSKEPLQVIPIWVTFPNLPVEYWAPRSLGRIASCLGKPICTDKLTTKGERVSYARILVEMDVSVELPEEVSIELPGGKCKLQNIKYEWRPLYCQSCLNIGHQNDF